MVDTPPVKTIYHDGESIDVSGIVVKLYNDEGIEWGEVPSDQLVVEPSVVYIPGEGHSYGYTKVFDNVTVVNTPPDTQGVWYTLRYGSNYSELITYSYMGYPGAYSPGGNGNHTFKYGNVYLRNANVGSHLSGPLFVNQIGDAATIELLKSIGVSFDESRQTIRIIWHRPDGAEFSTEFYVSVVDN